MVPRPTLERDAQAAPDQPGPLAHAGQSERLGVAPELRLRVEADAVVADGELEPPVTELQGHVHPVGRGVSLRVGDRLLGDAEDGEFDVLEAGG